MGALTRQDFITALHKLRTTGLLEFKGNLTYRSSENIQIPCPFHRDKSPSLRIELNTGVWYCHSCHNKGNLNSLCLRLANMPLRDFLGIPDAFDYKVSYQRRKPLPPSFPPLMIKGFTTPALETRVSYTYLKKRRIQESVAKDMNILYSQECSINGSLMKNRLLFPMYNEHGEIINVECRSINPKENPPKVLYPKNTAKPLYDDHNLDRNKTLYLVEGLMDLARLREDSRFKNSTATFGTGLSDYQRNKLILFDKIILIPDNDAPGKEFAELLKDLFKDKFSIMRIKNTEIKDVGDIPIHISDFYNQKGFVNTSFWF